MKNDYPVNKTEAPNNRPQLGPVSQDKHLNNLPKSAKKYIAAVYRFKKKMCIFTQKHSV